MAALINAFQWDEPAVLRAREMWDNGLSCRDIGLQFGTSKNAVISIARRRSFPNRERLAPGAKAWAAWEDRIIRDGAAEGKSDPQMTLDLPGRSPGSIASRRKRLGVTLSDTRRSKAHADNATAQYVVRRIRQSGRDKSDPQPPQIVHSVFPADLHCEEVDYTPQHNGCRWMISGARPWTVCASDRMDGSSYCVAHQKRSMKHPELMEQAA